MSVFGDFMVGQAVSKDEEIRKLKAQISEAMKLLDEVKFELRTRGIDDIALGLIEPFQRKIRN